MQRAQRGFFRRVSAIEIILPFVGHLPRGMSLDYVTSLSLIHVLLCLIVVS